MRGCGGAILKDLLSNTPNSSKSLPDMADTPLNKFCTLPKGHQSGSLVDEPAGGEEFAAIQGANSWSQQAIVSVHEFR